MVEVALLCVRGRQEQVHQAEEPRPILDVHQVAVKEAVKLGIKVRIISAYKEPNNAMKVKRSQTEPL